MTLFSASHATKVLALSVALAASGMMAAEAGDGRHHRHREHHSRLDRLQSIEPGHHGGRLRTELRYAERARDGYHRRPDRNFYGGAVSAYRDPGNGIYFYVDNDRAYDVIDAPFAENGGPKVIHVIPGQDDCSWEAGVCVIRSGR
jgi:hypothetical protein